MQPAEAIREFFREYPLTKQKRYLIALSGGPDSMVLLTLFKALNLHIEAAHCNFQLRGKDSLADELFVKKYCKKHNIKLHCKRFGTKAFCKTSKVGLQEGARMLRYEWFNNLLQKHELDFVVTAHHKNDLAETYLFNFLRGTGINGLRGIPAIRKKIIRPLLESDKEAILAVANLLKIPFRTDRSNLKADYSRNYIRLVLMPELEKEIPSAVQQISDSARQMQLLVDYRTKQVNLFKENYLHKQGNQTVLALKHILIDNSVTHLFRLYLHELGFTQNQVSNICKAKHGSRFFAKDKIALIDRENLIIEQVKMNQSGNKLKQILVTKDQVSISLPTLNATITLGNKKPDFSGQKNHYLDTAKLSWPLVIRPWEAGDKIKPIGMKGFKKVSDLLTDSKISPLQKKEMYVLISDKELVAVLGLRSSEDFKITETTTSFTSIVLN
jgi:tRNA(Ile)-lysidine synthase